MVESKCIEVDNNQSSPNDPDKRLNNQQWQAMIALHRTLLQEHHDFILASQHARAASPALGRLAAEYAMPARMWRHGIDSFPEPLPQEAEPSGPLVASIPSRVRHGGGVGGEDDVIGGKARVESNDAAAAAGVVADVDDDPAAGTGVVGIEENVRGIEEDAADVEKDVADVEEGVADVEKGMADVEKGVADVAKDVANIEKDVADTNDTDANEIVKRNDDGGTQEAAANTDHDVADSNERTKERLADTNDGVLESKFGKGAAGGDDLADTEERRADPDDDVLESKVDKGATGSDSRADSKNTTATDGTDAAAGTADPASTAATTVLHTDPVPVYKPPLHPPLCTKPFDVLSALSDRPYAERVADPSDFANPWENIMVPWLRDLGKSWLGGLSFDVHAGLGPNAGVVERVMFVTFSFGWPAEDQRSKEAAGNLAHTLRTGLVGLVPARFQPFRVSIHQCSGSGGVVERCHSSASSSLPSISTSSEWGRRWWWGGQADAYSSAGNANNDTDRICDPQHTTFHETPVMGMSIGPSWFDDAATMGGFVRVGEQVYGMSAAHLIPVGDSNGGHIKHPATRDVPLTYRRGRAEPEVEAYSVGRVRMSRGPEAPRRSRTFEGTNVPEDERMVEMDW
jgi:hypothetical protein